MLLYKTNTTFQNHDYHLPSHSCNNPATPPSSQHRRHPPHTRGQAASTDHRPHYTTATSSVRVFPLRLPSLHTDPTVLLHDPSFLHAPDDTHLSFEARRAIARPRTVVQTNHTISIAKTHLPTDTSPTETLYSWSKRVQQTPHHAKPTPRPRSSKILSYNLPP